MSKSMSVGNQLHRMELALAGAATYTKTMPRETQTIAKRLTKSVATARKLAADQEKAKQDLALATTRLADSLGEGNRDAAAIVRLAEVTFGPRHPRLREFRPATEGKVFKRAPRTPELILPATPANG